MNYYIDTEFHEYKKDGINTIELISIGIVTEDGSELYLISSEFDIDAAWDNDWLKDNVLHSIFRDTYKETTFTKEGFRELILGNADTYCINVGLTNNQIADKIIEFIAKVGIDKRFPRLKKLGPIHFYGYYADYDWVVFCWLFGRMIDLPKEFPMYCIDLKQLLDAKVDTLDYTHVNTITGEVWMYMMSPSSDELLDRIKACDKYPKQDNEHNALDDANWNKKLHEFINSI